MHEPSDYSTRFAERLAEIGLEPVLIGALAANLYRTTPRLTTDVDFLTHSLVGVQAAFEDDGYEVRVMLNDAGIPYVAFIRGHGVRVDVLAAETDYQRTAISRAINGALTVEDVIVHKLIAWRPRDQDDVRDILAARPALDIAYIAEWSAAWEVTHRWDEARRLDPP